MEAGTGRMFFLYSRSVFFSRFTVVFAVISGLADLA
jgi:hypothetical protein